MSITPNFAYYPGPQNSIVLPYPGNDDGNSNRYYLIHKRQELVYEPNIEVSIPELLYTYIDMSGNNGRGTIIEKNKAVFKTTNIVSGYLSACKHTNGKDWWLVQMEEDTNVYFKVLVSEYGFTVDSQRIEESPVFVPNSGVGQAVFSPDGKKWITNDWYDGCLIFDFDRSTGQLSNLVRITPPNNILTYVGVAVSPNSRFIYLSNGVTLFQLDLLADDIPGSIEVIAHRDSFPDPNFFSTFGQAQLAPDCKIYIVSGATNNYLHVINKPDEKGKACDFHQHSVYLPQRNYNNCIPNFPHFRMDEDQICDPTITSMFGDAVWYRKDLEVYPNTSSGVFNVRLPDVGSGKLVVIDMSGQIVKDKEVSNIINEERIDLFGFPEGSYFIEFWPDRSDERIFYGGKVMKVNSK